MSHPSDLTSAPSHSVGATSSCGLPPEQEAGAARSSASAPRGGRCPPAVRPRGGGTGAGSTLVSTLIPWSQLGSFGWNWPCACKVCMHSRVRTAERRVCSISSRSTPAPDRAGAAVSEDAAGWIWGLLEPLSRGCVCLCQDLGVGRAWWPR